MLSISSRGRPLARLLSPSIFAGLALSCTGADAPMAPVSGSAPNLLVTASTQTVMLVSGVADASGRDAFTTVVAVNDPFASAQLGSTVVPFAAYRVSRHPAYGSIAGATWIGPYPFSSSLQNTTHDGRYELEREFIVPDNSSGGSLTLRIMADNAVTVFLDGVQIGQQTQADLFSNFQSVSTFTASVAPGTHTLRFVLRNGIDATQGGPTALLYSGTLTYDCDEGFGGASCLDTTAPIVTPTVTGDQIDPSSGWFTSDVNVSFDVRDDQSSVTTTGCGPATVTSDTPLATFTCTATSEGGSTTETVNVRRDATAPTITYSGALAAYTVDQVVSITCSASDATSGLASHSCADIAGPAYSFLPGANTFTASATDNAGNATSATMTVNVVVTCDPMRILIVNFVSDGGWEKKLVGRLNNICDKVQKDSPALDEQTRHFLNELARAQNAGAISPANAAVLALLVHSL